MNFFGEEIRLDPIFMNYFLNKYAKRLLQDIGSGKVGERG